MRILIDTNILIDYLANREPYVQAAEKIVDACTNDTIDACIAAHTISNMFYILRKQFTISERKELLKGICTVFDVIGIDHAKIMDALNDDGFEDFEDCLQVQCAKEKNVDFIVTRNPKDFKNSSIRHIEPDIFVKMFL